MNTLITGANGFIGRHLTDYLLNRNIKIKGTVRDPNCQISPSVTKYCTGDIDENTCWKASLENVDVVYHLAGTVHRPNITDPRVYQASIDAATNKLASEASAAGVKKFIYFSSLHVYGVEVDHEIITESTPKDPHTPYGRAKLAAENKLQNLADNSSMEVIIIRPPLVYGKGVKGNFAQLIRLVNFMPILPFGCATHKRSFIGVDNLVDFAYLCSQHPRAANKVFNISDDNDLNTRELCQKLALLLAKKQMLLPIPRKFMQYVLDLLSKQELYNKLFESVRLDINQAKTLLDWQPRYTVDEQLLKTLG